MSHSLKPYSPSCADLLADLLEEPRLVSVIQSLSPHGLGRIIARIGLEEAGELVALATAAQLEALFDDDLWRSGGPGRDDRFDPERFGLWLEIMQDMGDRALARRLAELDPDLLAAGLSQQVLVINPEELLMQMARSGEDSMLAEKALEGGLYEEFFEYQVIARDTQHWDAVLAALTALHDHEHGLFVELLEQCSGQSGAEIDDAGGLYEALSRHETMMEDIAAAREYRRARQGYVAPADARAFLELARVSDPEAGLHSSKPDPVTRAVFKTMDPPRPVTMEDASREIVSERTRKMIAALEREDEARQTPAALLTGPQASAAASPLPFQQGLLHLRRHRPDVFGQAMSRLGMCANILISGGELAGRAFRPMEAAAMTVATCNLGLHYIGDTPIPCAPEGLTPQRVAAYIADYPAEKIFGLGWHVLHRDVVAPAARALLHAMDNDIAAAVDVSRIPAMAHAATALRRAIQKGVPWEAMEAVRKGLPGIDPPRRAALEGLVARCPVLRGGLGQSRSAGMKKNRRHGYIHQQSSTHTRDNPLVRKPRWNIVGTAIMRSRGKFSVIVTYN